MLHACFCHTVLWDPVTVPRRARFLELVTLHAASTQQHACLGYPQSKQSRPLMFSFYLCSPFSMLSAPAGTRQGREELGPLLPGLLWIVRHAVVCRGRRILFNLCDAGCQLNARRKSIRGAAVGARNVNASVGRMHARR
jgi:hypothetical protein